MPFLEAPHLETHLDLWQRLWSAGGVALCVAAVVVRSVRVAREVQRAHGCVASSWRAWCSGDLGDGWAEVLLSEQSQVSESLAEECEAVGEARPPRRVARIGGFIGAASGVFCRSNARAEGSTIVCVRLDGDSPWWRSSGGLLSLQRVVVFGVAQRW